MTSLVVASAIVIGGCGSDSKAAPTTKKPATGSAKSTTKQPPRAPKPDKKAGGNVIGSGAAAVPVESDPECTAAEEGLATCVDTFAVFCAGAKVYAIDCAEAYGGTCGEVDAAIDCVVAE